MRVPFSPRSATETPAAEPVALSGRLALWLLLGPPSNPSAKWRRNTATVVAMSLLAYTLGLVSTNRIDFTPKRAPGKTRAMVKNHWLNGRSGPWIARRVGVSTQAVYSHLASLRTQGELDESRRKSA